MKLGHEYLVQFDIRRFLFDKFTVCKVNGHCVVHCACTTLIFIIIGLLITHMQPVVRIHSVMCRVGLSHIVHLMEVPQKILI